MKAYDFEYDGIYLSDKGFMICDFDSKSVETTSMGSEINFNTVSTMHGLKQELASSDYDDCISAIIQICKHPCRNDDTDVSIEEAREIMQWLNRKGFHKFKLVDDEYLNIYFKASFNVSKIEISGGIKGFELEMITNSPCAYHEPIRMTIKNIVEDGSKAIISKSDEEGYIYPEMEITINKDGDLEIYNEIEDRTTYIKNCKVGEVIKMNYPIIETSFNSHKIMDDFNWRFFRIARKFKQRENRIRISLPCTIKIKYIPTVKVGV